MPVHVLIALKGKNGAEKTLAEPVSGLTGSPDILPVFQYLAPFSKAE
jgi:hypothetical protein